MAGKLNGVIPATTPRGWAIGVDVDAGRHLLGVAALQQVGHAAGELQVLEAAGDLALGVGKDLAVLGGNRRGDVLAVGVEQLAHAEQDLGPPGQPGGPPGREGGPGRLHGQVHLGGAGQVDLGDLLAEGRVVHGPVRPDVPATSRPSIQWLIRFIGAPRSRSSSRAPCRDGRMVAARWRY